MHDAYDSAHLLKLTVQIESLAAYGKFRQKESKICYLGYLLGHELTMEKNCNLGLQHLLYNSC